MVHSANLVVHPDYIASLSTTPDTFLDNYHTFVRIEFPKQQFKRITEFARYIAQQKNLGKRRVGYISLLVQEMHTIPVLSQEAGPQAFIILAEDIMEIAELVCEGPADEIQVAITYWGLGRQAKELALSGFSVRYYSRAAETYIRQKRWRQVSDLYWNLGLAEAAAGYKGNSVGWLSLSAEVSHSLDDLESAKQAIARARDVNDNFTKYCLTLAHAEATLGLIEQIHENVLLANDKSYSMEKPVSFIGLTELPGVGRVATQGVLGGTNPQWRHSPQISECLEYLYNQEWPIGIITAQAVDLRVIARLFDSPKLLDNLQPRALETLIAKLLEGFGAQVELTKATRDGGYDVGATFEIGDGKYRILIEAKKWKQERKVGIETVDRMLGVCYRLGADKACIVTTSTFSNVAKRTAAQLRMEMDLVDRQGLMDWVNKYLLPTRDSAIKLPSIIPNT